MSVYKHILEEIKTASHIVITSHKSPDGDSIGSSLGLFQFIKKLGKTAYICHPDPAPTFLEWLEDFGSILTMQLNSDKVKGHFEEADLIFCLDYNGPDRVGDEMQSLLENAKCKRIMIDHHLDPVDFVDIAVSDPTSSSTAQLVYELIEQSGCLKLLDEQVGMPLYLGILTDTGSFRFSSVKPRTHEVLGKLIQHGVRHHLVHEHLNDNNTASRLRLQGYAISEKLEILDEHQVAIISMTAEELKRFNYAKGDTDNLANIALSIKGIKAAVFVAEKDGKVKLSFRSKGEENPVNVLAAEHFDGGGHANASGGVSFLSIDETVQKLKSLVPSYF
ncbi:bifunctional oligoribonuclease/PAP phosphatase NrnA [Cytophagaceae bacterium ABcell3]|nr:bifunctional oligoribonuclease/PAP phosphatase NrnA [Cytophagaceae bacterium ABcell3]